MIRLLLVLVSLLLNGSAFAGTLPPGFQEDIVLGGLNTPTAVRFVADGRVFVAEKSGIIKVFDGLNDPTSTVFADLSINVHDFWDRGLLGLALPPDFPTTPWVYVLYAMGAPIGGNRRASPSVAAHRERLLHGAPHLRARQQGLQMRNPLMLPA